MTIAVENYCCVVTRRDGKQIPSFGSLREPTGESTLGGDHILPVEQLSIEPQDYIVIFDQAHRKLKFSQLGFRIIGDGSLTVFMRYDLPTASDNYQALGTRQRWRNQNWPCKMQPWWACQQTAYSLSSLTSEVADSGGLPGLMTNLQAGTADTVICDKVLLYNPAAADGDPVLVEKLLLQ